MCNSKALDTYDRIVQKAISYKTRFRGPRKHKPKGEENLRADLQAWPPKTNPGARGDSRAGKNVQGEGVKKFAIGIRQRQRK